MFEFFFGKTGSSRRNRSSAVSKRRLCLESLEMRELLSVSPLLPNQFEASVVDWFETLHQSEHFDKQELTESGDAFSGQWIIQLDSAAQQSAVSVASVAEQLAPLGITVLGGLGTPGLLLTQVGGSTEVEQSEILAGIGCLESWQPNYVVASTGIVQDYNDPDIDQQWALDSINAGAAWNVSNGSGVVVAVLDSGTALTHPDLRDNIWINTAEIAGDGIDNDGNGFIDDVYGWNFVSGNSNITDTDGHGTHVAGIIGAAADNGIGGSGAAPGVQLLSVKVISGSTGSTANIVAGIYYLIDLKSHGVNVAVINMSLGYYNEDPAVGQAIKAAGDAGMVVVASAGNDGKDNDAKTHYPSGYNNLNNLISVASINSSGQLASNSNYGRTAVDLAAPGVSIYSTTKNGAYGLMSGTSMAAPFVSAAAAILAANDSSLPPSEIKTQILSAATPLSNLSGKVASGSRLNFSDLFIPEQPAPPNAPTGLAIITVNNNSVTLQWRDKANNETGFELQYSTDGGATWTPSSEQIAVNRTQAVIAIIAGTNYQFQVRAVNEYGNSDWSNSVTMPTVKPAKPTTPTGVKVTAAGSQKIIVSWNTVSNVTAYRVERSLSAANGWNEVYSGSDPAFADTGLDSNTKYYYRVYALNYYIASGASNVIAGITQAEKPAAPSNVYGTAISATTNRISWDTVVHAASYRIEFFDVTKNIWSVIGTTASNTIQHRNLTASTAYQYRVIAISTAGESAPSIAVNVKTPTALPAAPANLRGTVLDSATIDLSWNVVNGATSYRLEYSLTGKASDWQKLGSSTITGTSGKAVNLAAGMKHYFRLFAINEAGESKVSNVFAVITPALPPDSAPNGLTAFAESDTKVNVFWNAVVNATQYIVERSNGSVWKKVATVSAVSTEVLLSGHKATTAYSYRVTAKSDAGTSDVSQTVSVTTRIKSPSPPQVTVLGNNSVKISWNSIKGVSGYRIEKLLDGSILWESASQTIFSASTKEYIDTNCDPNTVYHYRLVAVGTNEETNSQASKSKSVTTSPAKPNDLTALEILDRQVVLSWNEVEGAKSYVVEKFNGTRWISAGTSKTTELTVKSLKANTDYQFRVLAVGKTGKSPAGDSITVKTAIAIPAPPGKLSVCAADSDSLVLTWKAVLGAASYTIQRYDTAQKIWIHWETVSELSYIDNGLTASTKYSYRIFAVNSTGQSKTAAKGSSVTLAPANGAVEPSALLLNEATKNTLKISFASPVTGRTAYRAEWSLDGVLWNMQKKIIVSDNTVLLTGLQSKTTYYVRLRLETASQISAWSNAEMFVTK